RDERKIASTSAQHPVTPSSRLLLAAYRGARAELPGKAHYPLDTRERGGVRSAPAADRDHGGFRGVSLDAVVSRTTEFTMTHNRRGLRPYLQIARIDHWPKNAALLLGVVVALFVDPSLLEAH